MEYTAVERDQEKRIVLSGQFTFADNQKFRQVMLLLEGKPFKSIELDFANVDFIDSAGLGMLLLLRDECLQRQISISIRSPKGQVEKIFMLAKFDSLFSMPPSV